VEKTALALGQAVIELLGGEGTYGLAAQGEKKAWLGIVKEEGRGVFHLA
jgi:hypothetical protein